MSASVLEYLATAPLVSAAETGSVELERWLRAESIASDAAWSSSVERALVAGFHSDRLGCAFAGGYQAALRALAAWPAGTIGSLCATEKRGAHPKAIATRVEPRGAGYCISGEKRFATLAPIADRLIVIACDGVDALGRNSLSAWIVPRDRHGVRVEPMAELPFVPEVPHATLLFDGVAVDADERIGGDAYTAVLKPFRTIEDLHVHAALVGHWLWMVRLVAAPREWGQRLLGAASALIGLAAFSPLDTGVHLALAGALADAARWMPEAEGLLARAPTCVRARWERDRALLAVASNARSLRGDAAWERVAAHWSGT